MTSKQMYVVLPSTALILFGLCAAGFWYYSAHQPDRNSVEYIKREVGRHILLPPNEQPVLATITDTTKVSSPFLKRGSNGDKVLIFAQARRVILYRPSLDRIVDVGPIEVNSAGK